MNDYRPISCEFHDLLESHAIRRTRPTISYRLPNGQPQTVQAVISDLFARDGVEYLKLDNGEPIRLDALISVAGVALDRYGDSAGADAT